MKLIQKIIQISRTLLIPCCLLTSCNYLDVIPPAQADFDDTMKDEAATLNFLFTCYGYIPRVHPFEFKAFEQSADELISPKMWDDYQQQVAWGTISPSYYNSWGGYDMNIWTPSYNWLGYVHHFLSLIDELQPTGVMTRRNIKPNVISWKHTIISVYCRHLARVRSSRKRWTRI